MAFVTCLFAVAADDDDSLLHCVRHLNKKKYINFFEHKVFFAYSEKVCVILNFLPNM